jgi:hypothetical protein
VQTDRVVQTTTPAVDVLWVIDNSCSMLEEQQALTANFPLFMDYFADSGLDWHVGVVSTDMDDVNHRGNLRKSNGVNYIDENVSDPVGTFTNMASMGTTGSWDEKGRNATYSALELLKNQGNAGFLRDEAALSIIVISDEDDYSSNQLITLTEFINWMLNLKSSTDMVTFSSVVGPPQSCSGAVETGDEYLAVTNQVGGIKWSICSQDWNLLLDELGMQAAGLKREFFLTDRPIIDSIEVWVEEGKNTKTFDYWDGGDPAPADLERVFTYDPIRNSIAFEAYIPDELAEVFVEYEIASASSYGSGGDEVDTAAK